MEGNIAHQIDAFHSLHVVLTIFEAGLVSKFPFRIGLDV
jgi:hypothetical protein